MSAEIKELFEGTWKLDRHENYQNYLDAAGKYILGYTMHNIFSIFSLFTIFAQFAASSSNFNSNFNFQ